jgi:hypothetical protein
MDSSPEPSLMPSIQTTELRKAGVPYSLRGMFFLS